MEAKNPRADQSARVSEGSVQTSRDPNSVSVARQDERPAPRDIIKEQPWIRDAIQDDFPELELASDEAFQLARLFSARHWMLKKREVSLSPMARAWADDGFQLVAGHLYDQTKAIQELAVVADVLQDLAAAILKANPINLGGDPM